jgi:predicted signal transduction protein with EAL and GGDEF domain
MPIAAAPTPIPWHLRLEARVIGGISVLVALSLAAVLVATTRAVTTRSLERTSTDLDAARTAFYRLTDDRAGFAAGQAALVTALPVFRAHMTDARLAGDDATLDAMGEEYRRQLKADFCIVADRDGRWTSRPGWPAGVDPTDAIRASIHEATAGRPTRAISNLGDRLFLIVSEPARFAEEILGTLTVGLALDDTLARQLAEVTHADVNLIAGRQLSASSLTGTDRLALAGLVSAPGWLSRPGTLDAVQRVGDGQYVIGIFPLSPGDNGNAVGRLVLLQNWHPTEQFVDEVRRRLLAAGAVIFGVAVGGGLLFSRRMSRPLTDLAAAAKDIAAGNLTRQMSVSGSSEAATMAVAFNEMSSSLRSAQDRLLHDALHDHLTQLPNRALFMERVQRASRRRVRHPEYTYAVLFVDVDRFKTVNDSLGHPAGDRLLIEIVDRMTATLRRDDSISRPADAGPRNDTDNTLARLGGDEFTVLVEDIHDPSDAVRIAERIRRAVAKPVGLGDGREVFTSVSVGIAISTSARHSGEELVRDADIAMYRAKASGGDRCAIFDVTMHERAVERLQLETDLRRAVERDEFRLQYQPIVSLGDHRVIGFEALLRWQHPERGLLAPAVFLAVAEETDLITRIDRWVLREACTRAREWQTRFPTDSPATVSVNISAKGFGQVDIVRQVADTLLESGLAAQNLRLEITESVAMADAERARITLIELKALGVRLSLDDFGTGYSSLSYLQRFPVDTLKIDRSFVAGMDQNHECREIIRTILNLARTLGLDVIAEGTETAAQVDYLEGLDCRFGQGYFFSRPLPLDQLFLSGRQEQDRSWCLPFEPESVDPTGS